jgi:protein-S-isoprenylcysteine O-methyltransferase Ste14
MLNISVQIIFVIDVILLNLLLLGGVWSVALPKKRVWPPPGKESWQHRLTWACFYLVFLANALLLVLDWDSWIIKDISRLNLGIPLALVGALLVSWGISTPGTRNTSGLRDGFVQDEPYRFMRNPQYLGDMLLFIGLSIIANSWLLWIAHGLLILVSLFTPLAEEVWLEEQYGDAYLEYKQRTPRFLLRPIHRFSSGFFRRRLN